MNTDFTLRLDSSGSTATKAVASACISLIDELESLLSRYRHGSDVSIINRMESGQCLFIHEYTYECIRLSLQYQELSEGLFNITLGRQIEHLKSKAQGDSPALQGALAVDPDKPAIYCIESGREIDLGGIGKGYALDKVKELAINYGINFGLISAGASTHLAFGEVSWPIQLYGDSPDATIHLNNQALSASGIEIQGSHILSPITLTCKSIKKRAWVVTDTAAKADALSTALMIAEDDQIAVIQKHSDQIRYEPKFGG